MAPTDSPSRAWCCQGDWTFDEAEAAEWRADAGIGGVGNPSGVYAYVRAPTDSPSGRDDGDLRCACEWRHPVDGRVDPTWPAELNPECEVHGAPTEAQGTPTRCTAVHAPNGTQCAGDEGHDGMHFNGPSYWPESECEADTDALGRTLPKKLREIALAVQVEGTRGIRRTISSLLHEAADEIEALKALALKSRAEHRATIAGGTPASGPSEDPTIRLKLIKRDGGDGSDYAAVADALAAEVMTLRAERTRWRLAAGGSASPEGEPPRSHDADEWIAWLSDHGAGGYADVAVPGSHLSWLCGALMDPAALKEAEGAVDALRLTIADGAVSLEDVDIILADLQSTLKAMGARLTTESEGERTP